LMLPALGMGEIGAIVLVNCQAESTFEGSDVILEEVRVLVKVDGLKGEFPQALSSVRIRC